MTFPVASLGNVLSISASRAVGLPPERVKRAWRNMAVSHQAL
jgi:hypothetical protein